MNKSVFITGIAKEDRTQIAEYIATDNKNASIKIVGDFYETFKLILKILFFLLKPTVIIQRG